MDTLLDSGKYSDLRIICRDQSWDVHRNIVSTKSFVFERMIDELPKAANPGVIDLTKDEPKIVEKMLRFIYQGEYDDEREISHPEPNLQTEARQASRYGFIKRAAQKPRRPLPNGEALIINIKVLMIAEKFGLNGLMDLAVEKHEEAVHDLWDAPSFERSISLLYDPKMDEVRSRELRRVTADVITSNSTALLERKSFRGILNRYGELATEVLSLIVSGKGWL